MMTMTMTTLRVAMIITLIRLMRMRIMTLMVMMPTSHQEGHARGREAWRRWQCRSWLWKLWWGWGWANDDDDDDDENNEDTNLSSGGSHSGKRSLTEMTMTIMIMRLIMVIMLWWCWRCQPLIRRVALGEEELDGVLGKGERDNGRCARPHDDALSPQPYHDDDDNQYDQWQFFIRRIIMIRAMMEMEVVTMVAVHGLTFMHSAHSLIMWWSLWFLINRMMVLFLILPNGPPLNDNLMTMWLIRNLINPMKGPRVSRI